MLHQFVLSTIENSPEITLHILYFCEVSTEIHKTLYDLAMENNIVVNFEPSQFILNSVHENPNHVINFVTIFLKQYLYRNRCMNKKPTKEGFLIQLINHQNMEFSNAKRNRKTGKHKKRWKPLFQFE